MDQDDCVDLTEPATDTSPTSEIAPKDAKSETKPSTEKQTNPAGDEEIDSMVTEPEGVGLDSTEEDAPEGDEVVSERKTVVKLSPHHTRLFILQFPLQPDTLDAHDEEEMRVNLIRVNLKANEVEIDLVSRKNPLVNRTVATSWVPQPAGLTYATGILRENEMSLTPVQAVVQLRPQIRAPVTSSRASEEEVHLTPVDAAVQPQAQHIDPGTSSRASEEADWVSLKVFDKGLEELKIARRVGPDDAFAFSPMTPSDYAAQLVGTRDPVLEYSKDLVESNILSFDQESTKPSRFAFSEFFSEEVKIQLTRSGNTKYLELALIFDNGKWTDYADRSGYLPHLVPDQVEKLKQLTVLTLAKENEVLPYDKLKTELGITSVRELENFLIQKCIYKGLVKGLLHNCEGFFKVYSAKERGGGVEITRQ